MAWTTLKAAVAAIIKTNGNNEITGALHQSVINSIIDAVGANATYKGIAIPTTSPGTPDGIIFYMASAKGTYSNFGGYVHDGKRTVILSNSTGSWLATDAGIATISNSSQKNYTNVENGNKFIKEAYIYGSGVNPAKTYYIRLVTRQDATYGTRILIHESESDFSSSVQKVTIAGIDESTDIITKTENNITVKLVVNWGAFAIGSNSGEGLRYVFNENAFLQRTSSFIYSKEQIATNAAGIATNAAGIAETKSVVSLKNYLKSFNKTGIQFVKEVYISGDDLDLDNKIYYIDLVVRQNTTRGNGFFLKEANPDYSSSSIVINVLNKTEMQMSGIFHADSSTKDISIDIIIDWNAVAIGSNSGEVLKWVFNPIAFEIENSPAIYSKIQLDARTLNMLETTESGEIAGGYINETQFEPNDEDKAENATSMSSWTGVGFWEQMTKDVVFNQVKLPIYTTLTDSTGVLKVCILDSLPNPGNFATVYEPHVVLTRSITNAEISQSPEKSSTIILDTPIKVKSGKHLVFFISHQSGVIRHYRFSAQNAGSTRHSYIYCNTADAFTARWLYTSGTTYLQVVYELFIKTNQDLQNLTGRVSMLESEMKAEFNPRITLPSVIYATVGRQLNLYYDAMILAIDRGIQSPANCSVQVTCDIGYGRERNYQLNAVTDDIGDHTFTVKVYNENKDVIQSRVVTLRVISDNAPASVANLLLVGDSTLNGGPVAPTIYDDFDALGSNIPTFWGGKGTAPANHFGWPGATFGTFATEGTAVKYAFNVSGVSAVSIRAVYSNNGSEFEVVEVYLESGSGYLRCTRASGTNDPIASGTLTKVSGGGDATITYSSFTIDPSNPFWNPTTDQLDIAYYRSILGMGTTKFDIVSFRLGVNESFGTLKDETNRLQVIQYAKDLIDAFLADNSSTKIIIELTATDGSTRGGWAANYGSDNPKEDYQMNVWRLRELMIQEFDDGTYNANVEVCATGCMVDRYYGFGRTSTQIADRIPINEDWHTNAVHPTTEGYYQLGDALFPHILKFIQ